MNALLVLKPCLEHQHVPKVIVPIATAREMLHPFHANRFGVKKSFISQSALAQQSFSPIPQRPAQPAIDGHTKTHLGPVDEMCWHVLVENLPEAPLAPPLADFHL